MFELEMMEMELSPFIPSRVMFNLKCHVKGS